MTLCPCGKVISLLKWPSGQKHLFLLVVAAIYVYVDSVYTLFTELAHFLVHLWKSEFTDSGPYKREFFFFFLCIAKTVQNFHQCKCALRNFEFPSVQIITLIFCFVNDEWFSSLGSPSVHFCLRWHLWNVNCGSLGVFKETFFLWVGNLKQNKTVVSFQVHSEKSICF